MKRHIAGFLFVAAVSLVLPACTTSQPAVLEDGYQLGDASKVVAGEAFNLMMLRYRYCYTYAPESREAMLEIIKAFYPEYPTDGLCTDMGDLVKQLKGVDATTLEQAYDLPKDIDLESSGLE